MDRKNLTTRLSYRPNGEKENNMKVINKNGTEINFESAIELMDCKICEILEACNKQEYFTAYEKAHEKKYGDEWELSKENPVY